MKEVYAILVALDHKNFTHYVKVPKPYYDSKEEADYQMQLLIGNKEFEASQLRVTLFWNLEITDIDNN